MARHWPDTMASVLRMLNDYFTPHAFDMVYQEVARFSHFGGTIHSVKFDPLPRMQRGGAFPEAFALVLRLQNASLSRADKSMVGASA